MRTPSSRRFHAAATAALIAFACRIGAADTVGFIAPQTEVREDAGSIVFTVYRVGGGVGAASVDYATADFFAHAGVNYTAINGTLHWADGDASPRQLTIPIINDGVYDGYPSSILPFYLHLTNAVGAVLGDADVSISLADIDPNPAGTLRLRVADPQATVRVAESAGSVAFTVERTGGTTGAVSLQVDAYGLSAALGTDFGAPTPASLSWLDGEGGAKTATIPIIDNATPQPNRDFGIAMGAVTGGASTYLYVQGETCEIVDDDAPVNGTLSYPSMIAVREADGHATMTVQRVGGSSGAVTVAYQTNDSSAIAGSDYTTVSGTLSWAAGDATPRTIVVPILDDAVPETDTNLYISFTNPTGGLVLPEPVWNFATIAIVDDDGGGTLAFSSDGCWVDESAGSAVVTVLRIGSTTGAITVDYATSDYTAVAPTDYAATAGTLSWAAGDASPRTIAIPLVADNHPNGSRTFYVDLANATGGAIIDLGYSDIAVAIADDDLPAQAGVIGFTTGQLSVAEGAGSATFTVTRTGGSTGRVTVPYSIRAGTATCPEDFTGEGSGTLVWADADATPRTIVVPIVDDAVAEGVESFTVSINVPSGGATNGPILHVEAIIVDDDAPAAGRLSFSAPTLAVGESAGVATFSVVRSGGVTGAVTVQCATARDSTWSAIEGSDFEPRVAQLTWNDGEGGAKTFAVTLVDDASPRGTRTFRAILSSPTGGALLDTPHGAPQCICTITDDDANAAGTLGFAAAAASVAEPAGTVQLAVNRSGGATGAVSVRYDCWDEDAIGGLDYTPVSGYLSWADGDATAKTITVPILDDAVAESDERFLVVLATATGGADIGRGSVPVTITDDDAAPAGRIGFASASTAVVEGGVAAITVSRVGGALGAVTVDYQLSDDTATGGVDWTGAASGTLSWADGDAADKTISITAVADGVTEGSERITAQLATPTGGAALTRAASAVTISDPGVSAAAATPVLSGHHKSCGLGAATAAALALGLALARRRSLGA